MTHYTRPDFDSEWCIHQNELRDEHEKFCVQHTQKDEFYFEESTPAMPAGANYGWIGRYDIGFKSQLSWWIDTTVDRLFSHVLQFVMPQWKWGLRAIVGYFVLNSGILVACVNLSTFISAFTVDLRQQL